MICSKPSRAGFFHQILGAGDGEHDDDEAESTNQDAVGQPTIEVREMQSPEPPFYSVSSLPRIVRAIGGCGDTVSTKRSYATSPPERTRRRLVASQLWLNVTFAAVGAISRAAGARATLSPCRRRPNWIFAARGASSWRRLWLRSNKVSDA